MSPAPDIFCKHCIGLDTVAGGGFSEGFTYDGNHNHDSSGHHDDPARAQGQCVGDH